MDAAVGTECDLLELARADAELAEVLAAEYRGPGEVLDALDRRCRGIPVDPEATPRRLRALERAVYSAEAGVEISSGPTHALLAFLARRDDAERALDVAIDAARRRLAEWSALADAAAASPARSGEALWFSLGAVRRAGSRALGALATTTLATALAATVVAAIPAPTPGLAAFDRPAAAGDALPALVESRLAADIEIDVRRLGQQSSSTYFGVLESGGDRVCLVTERFGEADVECAAREDFEREGLSIERFESISAATAIVVTGRWRIDEPFAVPDVPADPFSADNVVVLQFRDLYLNGAAPGR